MGQRLKGSALWIAVFYGLLYLGVPILGYGQPETSTQPQSETDLCATNQTFITELLPNPAGTDTGNEFIELYNPSQHSKSLTGYTLKLSNKTSGYTFGADVNLEAQGYLAVYDSASAITLVNSTGTVELLDPSGNLIQSVSYSSAQDGKAWSLVEAVWQWAEPTASSANSLDGATDDDPCTLAPVPAPKEYLAVDITEVFPDPVAPQTDALDEFVELFNPNNEPVDLVGYVIKTGGSLQHSYVLPTLTLAPQSHAAFYSANGNLSLSNAGGLAQIFDPEGNPTSELVDYSTAEPGSSWALIDNEWQWTEQVTPGAPNQAGGQSSTAPGGLLESYPAIIVNEALVDPDSPGLDDEDEFVELFNPNPGPVNLGSYKILTGSTLKTAFTLPADIIGPGEYRVYYSKDANISLSNGGGSVRLVDPNGLTSSETQTYDKATAGDAWARFDNGWQWTSAPTPGAANTFAASAKAAKAAKAKKAATKKASTKKPKAAKAKKANAEPLVAPATIAPSPLSTGIVATAAGLALLYGAYEFRYDLRNKFELARRYFAHRWHSGP